MRHRFLILTAIFVPWAALFGYIFYSSHQVIVNGMAQLEHSLAIQDTNKIEKALHKQLEEIHTLGAHLSKNTTLDKYLFVKPSKKSLEQFVTPELFLKNDITNIYIANNFDQIIDEQQFDLSLKQFTPSNKELSNEVDKLLRKKLALNTLFTNNNGHGLIISTAHSPTPYFVSINAIKSKLMQDTAGWIILAKPIDKNLFKKLSDNYQDTISSNEFQMVSSLKKNSINKYTKDNSVFYLSENSQHELGIHKLVTDYKGDPVFFLSLLKDRKTYQQNQKAMLYHLSILIIYSIVSLIAMFIIVYIFSYHQQRYISAFEKFVPKALLKLLNKPTLLDIKLGNHAHYNFAVFFLDIRDFTKQSENMTPEETFTFINNFLTYIAPLIAKNHGFIDKYTGDGLMAIFPEEQSYAFDAINSGLAIFKALKKINTERLCQNKHQIQIGIGIHSGPIMLGIIGEQRRYEGTVISDVVNTAARIEGLTKEYGQPLIISEPIKNQLPSTHPYELSQLEPINIRGKSKSVALYSVKID